MRYIALWLTGICILIFVLQLIFPQATELFALVSSDVLQRPWIFLTSMFLHGSLTHLIYNMFALALFGTILEKIIESKRFTILYIVSGIVSGIGAAIFYPAAIGASGAIFGVLGCLAVLRPKMRVWVSYVPMPMFVAAGVWIAGDLIGMFAPSGTANAAHLFGMFFGIGTGFYYMKKFGENKIKREIKSLPEKEVRQWEDRWM